MRPSLCGTALVAPALRLNPCKLYPSRVPWLRRQQHMASENRLPRLAQTSFWDSIIPRSFRTRSSRRQEAAQAKLTNPATYFIWIYILIGSQAIRIMGVKSEFMHYSRKADLKLQQLREVVQKLQNGEEVDVEKILGTGDETQEREWEEVLEELQREDRVWQRNSQTDREAKERAAKEEQDANPVNEAQTKTQTMDPSPSPQPVVPRSPGFY